MPKYIAEVDFENGIDKSWVYRKDSIQLYRTRDGFYHVELGAFSGIRRLRFPNFKAKEVGDFDLEMTFRIPNPNPLTTGFGFFIETPNGVYNFLTNLTDVQINKIQNYQVEFIQDWTAFNIEDQLEPYKLTVRKLNGEVLFFINEQFVTKIHQPDFQMKSCGIQTLAWHTIVEIESIQVFNWVQDIDAPVIIQEEEEEVANAKPIEFLYPPYNGFITEDSTLNTRVCLRKNGDINDQTLVFYVNGIPYPMPNVRGDFIVDTCGQLAHQNLPLVKGENILQVRFIDEEGIEYESDKLRVLSMGDQGKNYAVYIAVGNYSDNSIRPLPQVFEETRALKNVIESNYTFNSSEAIFLENPNKQNLIDVFNRLDTLVKPQDRLLIFYSGHASSVYQTGEGAWQLEDAIKNMPETHLSYGELNGFIRQINADNTLIIADACHSGALIETPLVRGSDCAIGDMKRSTQAMTSSQSDQYAPGESVFVQVLKEQLENNPNDCISADDLFKLVKPIVIRNNGSVTHTPQFGELSNLPNEDGGMFIFYKK